MKNWKRTLACAAAILVVITALTLFSGCIEEDEDNKKPIIPDGYEIGDEVINYIDEKTLGMKSVVEQIGGEGSIYALAEEETDAKGPSPDFTRYAKVVTQTYYHPNGSKIIMHNIKGKQYDDEFIKKQGINLEEICLSEDQIHPLMEIMDGGRINCSKLEKSTKNLGLEYVYDNIIKKSKAKDNIMGNNKGDPEIFLGVAQRPNARYMEGVGYMWDAFFIFNEAFLRKYKDGVGNYLTCGSSTPLEVESIDDIVWAYIQPLEIEESKRYGKLTDGFYYQRFPVLNDTEQIFSGSPDPREICIHLEKA
jgi:hypothetical protein